jgi:hypothetical protein
MRPVLVLALLLSASVVGLVRMASGHDTVDRDALDARIQKMELRIDYLLSREKAVTEYVLRNQQRAADLSRGLAAARAEGFTAGAISSTSREALLGALEAAARDLGKDLPEVTKEQKSLLEHADLR